MDLQFPILTPSTPTPRYKSPARRNESPDRRSRSPFIKRTDSFLSLKSWRSSAASPEHSPTRNTPVDFGWRGRSPAADQSPACRSVNSSPIRYSPRKTAVTPAQSPTRKGNPFADNNWRLGTNTTNDAIKTPSPLSPVAALEPEQDPRRLITQEPEKPTLALKSGSTTTPTVSSPILHKSSSTSALVESGTERTTDLNHPEYDFSRRRSAPAVVLPRTQSPRKYDGIANLLRNGTLSGRVDCSNWPQFKAAEEAKQKRIAEKLQPTKSAQPTTEPVTTVCLITRASKHNFAMDSPNNNADVAKPQASVTPKPKKKNIDNQASHQKSRKPARTPADNTVTPLKQQQYYAGPAFQNSPAASSLPIPKFFLQQEAAKVSSGESSPTAKAKSPALNTVTKSMGSLDLLFDADRKEKATKQQTPKKPAQQNTAEPAPQPTQLDERQRQNQQLKQLLHGKPSTPPPSRPHEHHYPDRLQSAPPHLQGHMSAPPMAQASHYVEQQPDNYYYGNRHLSSMFEAARQGSQSNPPAAIADRELSTGYRPSSSYQDQRTRNQYPQYSPNPTKTAPYQQYPPLAQAPTNNMPEYSQQAVDAMTTTEKEVALRKLLGLK